MVAAIMRVPTTLGYFVGGYLVGPSSPILTRVSFLSRGAREESALVVVQRLQHIDVIHTVAMLGPMFDLFCLGIMYASLRSKGVQRVRGRVSRCWRLARECCAHT
jgi:Kef-type K+ transport system membrane component KefB